MCLFHFFPMERTTISALQSVSFRRIPGPSDAISYHWDGVWQIFNTDNASCNTLHGAHQVLLAKCLQAAMCVPFQNFQAFLTLCTASPCISLPPRQKALGHSCKQQSQRRLFDSHLQSLQPKPWDKPWQKDGRGAGWLSTSSLGHFPGSGKGSLSLLDSLCQELEVYDPSPLCTWSGSCAHIRAKASATGNRIAKCKVSWVTHCATEHICLYPRNLKDSLILVDLLQGMKP